MTIECNAEIECGVAAGAIGVAAGCVTKIGCTRAVGRKLSCDFRSTVDVAGVTLEVA